MVSMNSLMIDWPDCLNGLSTTLRLVVWEGTAITLSVTGQLKRVAIPNSRL